MSYQVLARKWRPKSFGEVVGQQHVLTILSNALSLGRVHHAYLFSGTRGVGKTSIARLLAKGLNCESGITATPCGICDNCRDIEQGRFVDLLEIDAASRTKVEDTREILDNIQYLPTKGRFKVYLIDEVHMLSRSSFNALLKTLEEPPEHVKFLLATTDPQKLPITILSRCLHLHLSILESPLISEQLFKILQAEKIEYEQKAIQLLSSAANGSMRDALSLTDQAIALGNGQVDENSVSTMLGTLDKNIPFSLIEALHQADGNSLMNQIDMAAKQGASWGNLLSESIALLHQIALLQVVPTALGQYSDNEDRIRFLAQYMAPNDVQLFYQILLMGRKDLTYSPDKKIGVEMCFLRALAFMPKTETNPKTIQTSVVTHQEKTHQEKIDSKFSTVERSPETTHSVPLDEKEEAIPITDTVKGTINDGKTIIQEEQVQTQDKSPAILEEMPLMTKNILELRMKLMQGEQNTKKSDSVEQAQPKKNVKPSPLAILKDKQTSAYASKSKATTTSAITNDTIEDVDDDNDNDEEEELTAETYQWQATRIIENKNELTVNTKLFLASSTNDKTPEMEQKLIDEVAKKDSWSNEIEQLDIAPLIKQIAVNSFIEQQTDNAIILHVRSSIRHLTNANTNITKLADALSVYRKQNITLQVVIDDHQGDNKEKLTPLELREALYQQKLEQTKIKIREDDKVAMICQFFEAKIDEASIRPV